jgi:hypothetical protein
MTPLGVTTNLQTPDLSGDFVLLATKTPRHEEKLTTDYTDYAEKDSHEKAQKLATDAVLSGVEGSH